MENDYQRCKNAVYDLWDYEYKLPDTQFTLRGHSRGGERTGFYISQLKLFLDAGVQSYFVPQTILITHCHADHSFAMPMLVTGLSSQLKECPQIFVPIESVTKFQAFQSSFFDLTQCKTGIKSLICGIQRGCIIDLKKSNCFAEIFTLDHSVPTNGYGIFEKRTRLKECFKHLDKFELVQLRKTK